MNAQAVEWVNKNSAYKRTSGTQAVLRTIAASYGADGSCLSIGELVKRSSVSEATAHRAISKLSQDGVIRVSRNGGDARRTGYTNRYQIFGFDLPVENGRGVTMNMTPRRAEHDTSQEGVSQKHDTPDTPKETPLPDTPPIVTPVDLPADYVPLPFDDVSGLMPVEYAGARVPAAGEKESLEINTSSSPKEKDKKTPLPAKAGKESARAHAKEQTPAGKEWDDLLAAIGDVFKAYGVEAINYANMFIGKAKKGIWGQCAFAEAVTSVELRRWWTWYRQKNPTVERVKEPPKVFSSITEWRKAIKPRIVPPANVASREVDPESGVTMTLTEEYLNTLRPSWKVSS